MRILRAEIRSNFKNKIALWPRNVSHRKQFICDQKIMWPCERRASPQNVFGFFVFNFLIFDETTSLNSTHESAAAAANMKSTYVKYDIKQPSFCWFRKQSHRRCHCYDTVNMHALYCQTRESSSLISWSGIVEGRSIRKQ